MDAVIMAAGLGTRLRPHTEKVPKPLLPVRGRPILDWALGALPKSVDRVIVVINYHGEQIEQYLRSQTHIPRAEVVWQKEPRGTGDALRSCQERLASRINTSLFGTENSERNFSGASSFLVCNGDDLYGAADLARMVTHRAAMLCAPVTEPEKFGIATTRSDGSLERLVEKPKGLNGEQLANAGVYTFPLDVFDIELSLSPRGEYEITQYVSELATRGRVAIERALFWLPIGDVAAWNAAQQVELDAVLQGR
ncbi:MAG: nucleotidyltransferase family protein [Planctomycetia bacterium]|nr:nucleotidyltransferase family protein [Planctomycetia bacterium]